MKGFLRHLSRRTSSQCRGLYREQQERWLQLLREQRGLHSLDAPSGGGRSFCDVRAPDGEGEGGPLEAVREETPGGETLAGTLPWLFVCLKQTNDIPSCSCSADAPIPWCFTRFAIPLSLFPGAAVSGEPRWGGRQALLFI